ncbi:MAG: hypothetical protein IPM35_07915 [Myxococcales bacterium]|nr:hypothetical protein [Myxococcales bacterium]
MRRRLAALVAACLVLLAPALALACPVCGVGSEANRRAFVGSTIFLSLLPLAMIGGLVGYAVWRVRKQERLRDAEAAAQSPARSTP